MNVHHHLYFDLTIYKCVLFLYAYNATEHVCAIPPRHCSHLLSHSGSQKYRQVEVSFVFLHLMVILFARLGTKNRASDAICEDIELTIHFTLKKVETDNRSVLGEIGNS